VTVPGKPGGRHSRVPQRRTWRSRRVIAILLALILMAAIVTIAAVFTYDHAPQPKAAPAPKPTGAPARPAPATSPAPQPAPQNAPNDALSADFAKLQSRLNAKIGVVVSPVGSGQGPMTLGSDWTEGPAWSTIKVPLVIAALRQQGTQQVTDTMKATITESDNAAAEAIWAQLGEPVTAGQRVQDVLKGTGDPTVVQYLRVRPPYTPFGQTIWSLTNQVRFLASASCDSKNDPIFALMSQVVPGQSWGIGTIAGTQFKGGWGPWPTGKYLVRQMGILTAPTGKVAVAIAAEPSSGQFDDGTKDLGEIADWLNDHLAALPAGKCASG